jgi:hypothetical protein
MKALGYLAAALMIATTIAGDHALANTCLAGPLVCPTTMDVDGFCECRAHGTTMAGTVATTPAPHVPYNATTGGCGAYPNDPGCHVLQVPPQTPMTTQLPVQVQLQ